MKDIRINQLDIRTRLDIESNIQTPYLSRLKGKTSSGLERALSIIVHQRAHEKHLFHVNITLKTEDDDSKLK